jgi:hypothetical protein
MVFLSWPRRAGAWFEAASRRRRFALARRPGWSTPACVAAASSFDFIDANPLAPCAFSRLAWVDEAAAAHRWMVARARALQAAFDDLGQARARLGVENAPLGAGFWRAETSAWNSLERERRGLDAEREALCLLARVARLHFLERPIGPDRPEPALGGLTLLAHYVASRRMEPVALLLWAGRDPEAPCSDGSTALSVARSKAQAWSGLGDSHGREAQAILAAVEAACLRQDGAGAQALGPARI